MKTNILKVVVIGLLAVCFSGTTVFADFADDDLMQPVDNTVGNSYLSDFIVTSLVTEFKIKFTPLYFEYAEPVGITSYTVEYRDANERGDSDVIATYRIEEVSDIQYNVNGSLKSFRVRQGTSQEVRGVELMIYPSSGRSSVFRTPISYDTETIVEVYRNYIVCTNIADRRRRRIARVNSPYNLTLKAFASVSNREETPSSGAHPSYILATFSEPKRGQYAGLGLGTYKNIVISNLNTNEELYVTEYPEGASNDGSSEINDLPVVMF